VKLDVFYSWQSDLPNASNRGLIGKALEVALKHVHETNSHVTEYLLDAAGRNEAGTPDLVASIFSKIDHCDVFIADVSITSGDSMRKAPNPNVLIELGYASSVLGWERIICLFNQEYGSVEDLPFDIRFRKPLQYRPRSNPSETRRQLAASLSDALQTIIDLRLNDKRFHASKKQDIDLALQAILIDFAKLLYSDSPDNIRKYDYQRMLHIGREDLDRELAGLEVLGFALFKDQRESISEFREFFNDAANMYFLSNQ